MKQSFKEKIKKIKLLVLDVDGILTNGQIVLDSKGKEIKYFDVQDGFGLVFFMKMGYKTAILSARSAPAVTARAKDLKINKICQNAAPKLPVYKKLLKEFKLINNQVCFMGDDLPDLKVLKQAGFAVAVPNAVKEVKAVAHYVTKNKGGEGAIREVVELILKVQGKWKNVLKTYS